MTCCNRSPRVLRAFLILCVASAFASTARAQVAAPAACTPIDSARFQITRPGLYCLNRDLHTRFDFADHRAEMDIIEIGVGNVTVDLQGHKIGRGRFISQHGGTGILITTMQLEGERGASPRIANVTIRNGVLSDFVVGVMYHASASERPMRLQRLRQTGEHSFTYDEANIVLENLKFERCDENMRFEDWVSR